MGSFVLKSYGNINRKDFKITSAEAISYKNDFIHYVKPLLVISLIIFFSTIFDRWLIQKFYGSKEQGYFVFASKLGDFLFILSSSIIPLLQREFAVEIKNRNFDKVKEIYKIYSQLLFSISVFFWKLYCRKLQIYHHNYCGERIPRSSFHSCSNNLLQYLQDKNTVCYNIFLCNG